MRNLKLWIVIFLIISIILVYKYTMPYYNELQLHQKTKQLYAGIAGDNIDWEIIAQTEAGNTIYIKKFGDGDEITLILAALHGDEQTGFHLVYRLADTLASQPEIIRKPAVIVPVVNPDGLLARSRLNAEGIDVNRNFPTKNWSPVYEQEKYYPGSQSGSALETQVMMLLINKYKPVKIIAVHDDLHMNNFDGPAENLAWKMAETNGYEVTSDVGYPTPGSLGSYAGIEKNIAVITLELPRISPEEAWRDNFQALIDAINF
ncbi:MAG: succinylglutamate desuccinylase/aspartoacylase family protein [Calditrichaceae bacterium]|nr:succinylglutamate desuccinylase/aspartoacylase family protein [Calditrichaceae bacterium]MBN2710162.1 succinylglutamate desuccinylase/aspartoacylase family protein [Calditrichaceae bacterium]RQV95815.1 MAG: hypothetical protein EH224_06480 [Calditrichota bacterium]